MNEFSNQIKFDIFKYLNFKQLISLQKSNHSFNKFIEENKNDLACEYFHQISVVHKLLVKYPLYNGRYENNENKLIKEINIKSEFYKYNISINDELKKKWEFAINNNIPLYLNYNEPCKAVINLIKVENKWFPEDEPEENMIDENGNPNKIRLRLPCFPKNIKEMFIIRYWLDKLFNCTFENSEFDNIIINSELIQLLFENENNKNLIKFRTNNTIMRYPIANYENQAMKFVKEYLFICKQFNVDFTLYQNIEQHYNILLNILNEGDKFPRIKFIFEMKPSFFELIKNHLKTSTNCSNFVSKFAFKVSNYDYANHHNIWTNDEIRAMAEKTKECLHYGSSLYYSKFRIINDNDPEIVFVARYTWTGSSYIKFNFKQKLM